MDLREPSTCSFLALATRLVDYIASTSCVQGKCFTFQSEKDKTLFALPAQQLIFAASDAGLPYLDLDIPLDVAQSVRLHCHFSCTLQRSFEINYVRVCVITERPSHDTMCGAGGGGGVLPVYFCRLLTNFAALRTNTCKV